MASIVKYLCFPTPDIPDYTAVGSRLAGKKRYKTAQYVFVTLTTVSATVFNGHAFQK